MFKHICFIYLFIYFVLGCEKVCDVNVIMNQKFTFVDFALYFHFNFVNHSEKSNKVDQ